MKKGRSLEKKVFLGKRDIFGRREFFLPLQCGSSGATLQLTPTLYPKHQAGAESVGDGANGMWGVRGARGMDVSFQHAGGGLDL